MHYLVITFYFLVLYFAFCQTTLRLSYSELTPTYAFHDVTFCAPTVRVQTSQSWPFVQVQSLLLMKWSARLL